MQVIGAPSAGSGILHAKPRNRFCVLFCDDAGKVLPYGNELSLQTISVSDITQTSFGEITEPVIVFEDDVDNHACSAIQNLFSEVSFMIKIEFRDGNDKTIRTQRLTGCSVLEVTHGFLDYADGSKLTKQILVSVNGMTIS